MKNIFFAILCMSSMSIVNAAGQIVGGKILQVRVDRDGNGMVFFDRTVTGSPPACGSNSSYNMALAFNSATAGGKSVLALVLSAKATGSAVTAYGLGVCGIYGVAEDWDYGIIQ